MAVNDVRGNVTHGRDGPRVLSARTELVGRDEELGRLRSLVSEVAAGRGRSVWVDGEPGIGKSALLANGLADADRLGCQMFAAAADESGSVFPLRVLLDALKVSPDATDPARAEIAERLWGRNATGALGPGDRVAAAAEWLLILIDRLCADGPVVLAADDLQWADEMSLAVWGRLRRATEQLPLLLVAAARPVPQREEVDRLRHDLAGTDAVVFQLAPLDESQVASWVQRLAAGSPGPRLRVQVAQAGGNPLYVRELVDAMMIEHRIAVDGGVAEVVEGYVARPASLAAAIAGRLNFLSKPATAVLRMATLFGGEFQVELLGLVSGSTGADLVAAIDEGLAAGVLAESGNALVFRHPLIHQALYATVPAPLRTALHRQAAQALDAAGQTVDKVAEQLVAAPQATDAWVVEWLIRAGPTLIYRAPRIAVDLLERVRDAIDTTDARRAHLDGHLVTALSQLGRYGDVEALARPLLADSNPAVNTKNVELVGQMAWSLAYALRVLGRFDQSLVVIDQAIARPSMREPWSVRLKGLRAALLINVGRWDEAREASAHAEVESERTGDRFGLGWALFALAAVQSRYDLDFVAASRTFERATAVLADEPDATDLRLLLLANRASNLSNLGRGPEATRVIGHALALAEQAGTPQRLSTLRVQAAELAFGEGRWDYALAELEAAQDLPPHNPTRLMRLGLTTLIAVHRDNRAVLAANLREIDNLALPSASVNFADTLLAARALAAERDGLLDEALTRLLQAMDPESNREFPLLNPVNCEWLADVVRLALATGDEATVVAATRACARAAEADRHGQPWLVAASQYCRGLVEADPALLLSAADSYGNLANPFNRARALEDAAVLLAQSGDAVSARQAYVGALEIYTDLEADWDIARADGRLRPLGIRRGVRGPRRRPAHGWLALTPTEVKIAYLIEAGKSNPDIAADLFLSRNTVQTHVSHILGKLNVRSRVDIAREVNSQRHDEPPPE